MGAGLDYHRLARATLKRQTMATAAGTSMSASAGAAPAQAQAQAQAQAYGLDAFRKRDQFKVLVRFKAVGSAPIMKNNVFRISAFNKFLAVHVFLRRELGCKPSDNLFLYINAAFSPALDDTVGNLFRVRPLDPGTSIAGLARLRAGVPSSHAWPGPS